MMDFMEGAERVTSGWILSGEKREKALLEELEIFGNRLTPKKIVECIHCGDKFRVNEAVVLVPYRGFKKPMVFCKNYPECNGSIIDMWPTKSLKKTQKFNGFEANIIPMTEAEVERMKERAKDLPKLKEGETPETGVWYRGF